MFSWWRVWSSESSGMYCRVLNWMSTDVSEVHAASIIRVMRHGPDEGGTTHVWNVGRHSIKNTAVHPRRFWASFQTNFFLSYYFKQFYLSSLLWTTCLYVYCSLNILIDSVRWKPCAVFINQLWYRLSHKERPSDLGQGFQQKWDQWKMDGK
jgi:hypothetical protein